MIKVIVADDNKTIQTYFKKILEETGKIEVCALASTRQEVVKLADELLPDIILMDIQMEEEYAGIKAIKEIRLKHPEIPIIVCTMYDDDDYLYNAFGNGATNYVLKSDKPEQLISVIYDAKNKTPIIDEKIKNKLFLQIPRIYQKNQSMLFVINVISKITKGEYEILNCIHKGMSYSKIASMRYIEETSLRVQISRIIKKFNKKTMKELIKELEKMNFFDIYETNLQDYHKDTDLT